MHLPLLRYNLESVCKKNTEAHTGYVENPLCNYKPHWEEEVGCRNKWQDDQREGLKKTDMVGFGGILSQQETSLNIINSYGLSVKQEHHFSYQH